MKKILTLLVLSFVISSPAYAEVQKDGFDVTPLFSATKSFNITDARIAAFKKFVEGNLHESSSGSGSYNDMENSEVVFLDDLGNSVKIASEKNTKTGVGTYTVTIIGPVDFVARFRAPLK